MDIATQIANKILKLKSGTIFILDTFLDEFNIAHSDKLLVCMAVLDIIKNQVKILDRYKSIAGLPYNLPRTRL